MGKIELSGSTTPVCATVDKVVINAVRALAKDERRSFSEMMAIILERDHDVIRMVNQQRKSVKPVK